MRNAEARRTTARGPADIILARDFAIPCLSQLAFWDGGEPTSFAPMNGQFHLMLSLPFGFRLCNRLARAQRRGMRFHVSPGLEIPSENRPNYGMEFLRNASYRRPDRRSVAPWGAQIGMRAWWNW